MEKYDLIIIDGCIGKFLDLLKSVKKDSTYEIKVGFVDNKELVGEGLIQEYIDDGKEKLMFWWD